MSARTLFCASAYELARASKRAHHKFEKENSFRNDRFLLKIATKQTIFIHSLKIKAISCK